MTLLLAGQMSARAVVMNSQDCEALGKKVAGNAPTETVVIHCEALPMYFASIAPLTTPRQPPFFPQATPPKTD